MTARSHTVNPGDTAAAAAGIAGFGVAGQGAERPGVPLGILTKLHSATMGADENGGDPGSGQRARVGSAEARRAKRARRWEENLNTGEPRLVRDTQLAFLREYLPGGYRTRFCLARLQFGREDVAALYNPESGGARFHGAAVCGSVWTCPVCGERITAKRRQDLKVLLVQTKYKICMATFTMEHHEGERLGPMVKALGDAVRKMKTCRAWVKFAEKWGIVGSVYALETTHGGNGWHPHRHEMFVFDPEKVQGGPEGKKRLETEFEEELFQLYHYQLNKAGRDCDREHGVKVSANRKDYTEYIAKWGVTEELTRSTNKIASGGGRSVWELLSDAIRGDARSWSLFLEYAAAFKGKKQLHWSKGLRELLEMGAEVSDQEAAEEPAKEKAERVVFQLSRVGWAYVLELDLRIQIVKYIEEVKGDSEKVLDFLARRGIRRYVMGPGEKGPVYYKPGKDRPTGPINGPKFEFPSKEQ